MPDWVDLGFHLLLSGQQAKTKAKINQMEQASVTAQQQAERENLGRQLIFEMGEGLENLEVCAESLPEAVYAATALAKRALIAAGIQPEFFSQISDKQQVSRLFMMLDGLGNRAAAGIDGRIEDADRFVQTAFPVSALITADLFNKQQNLRETDQQLQEANQKLKELGKGRQIWNLLIGASVFGLFVLPCALSVVSLLASNGSLNGFVGGVFWGILIPVGGIVVGLIARSSATPKDWRELKKVKAALSQSSREKRSNLPTPQKCSEMYKEAGIASDEEFRRLETEFKLFIQHTGLAGIPALPIVHEVLNP